MEDQLHATQLELQRARTPPPILSQSQVRELLAPFGAQTAWSDLQEYIRLSSRLDESPELTQAIMATREFQHWISSAASQMLFVSEDMPLARVSSGSFFTATLAQVVSNMQHAITLSFFFGLHAGISDGRDIAGTMFASLIAQLLSLREYPAHEWASINLQQEHAYLLANRHLPTLAALFQKLVSALPWGMVFCLIDDFYRLEDLALPESLKIATRTLSELVHLCNSSGRSGIKIMAVTPDWKGDVVSFVQDEDMIRIGRASRAKSYALTPKQMQYGIVRDDIEY